MERLLSSQYMRLVHLLLCLVAQLSAVTLPSYTRQQYSFHRDSRSKARLDCGPTGLICLNGGQCFYNSDAEQPRCLCRIGFGGSMCGRRISAELPKFSGHSFIELGSASRLMADRRYFSVTIKFIPLDVTGVLLYIGRPQGDYAALSLVNGTAIFRFDCGSGSAELKSQQPIVLEREVDVTIKLMGNMGYLSVDYEHEISGKSKGSSSFLDVTTNLFVGGHRDPSRIAWQTGTSLGFTGGIISLQHDGRKLDLRYKSGLPNIVTGLDIEDFASSVCMDNVCQSYSTCMPLSPASYKCLCPVGRSGSACEKDEYIDDLSYIPRIFGESYLLYNSIPQPLHAYTQITLSIKPSSGSGLLFYTGGDVNLTGEKIDFLSISLDGAQVVVKMDLGSGTVELRSGTTVYMDTWYVIKVDRRDRNITLTLNGKLVDSSQSPGSYVELNVNRDVFIGGHIDLDTTAPSAEISKLYTGCIFKVSVNGVPLLVKDARSGMNIETCPHQCQSRNVCGSEGRCVPEGDDFSCACPLSLAGPMCEDPGGTVTKPYFKGSSYLMLNGDSIISNIVSDRWSIRINLRAACTSCVVMWIGQELSVVKGDYLFVALDEFGYPEVGFDLGGGAVRLKYDLLNVTDGSPHTIELQRHEDYATLRVNNKRVIKFPDTLSRYKELNTNTGLYLGGYPPGLGVAGYKPFTGCIELIQLSSQPPINPIQVATRGENIEQCDAGS